jgi:hypothetical protein
VVSSLVTTTLRGPTQHAQPDVVQRDPDRLADDLTGEDGEIGQHRRRPVTETGAFGTFDVVPLGVGDTIAHALFIAALYRCLTSARRTTQAGS